MTGLGAGFILLFLLLYNTRTCYCNYADVLWGQCSAFCLTQHESRLFRSEGGVNHAVTVKSCRRDKVCRWCLHPCERPREEYQDQESCRLHCQKTRLQGNQMGQEACNDSCEFINQSFVAKFGSCPSIDNHSDDSKVGERDVHLPVSSNDGDCMDQCQRDIDCGYTLKCCINGCQKTCLRFVEWNYLPSVPEKLKFKTRRDGMTLVEWKKAVAELSAKPVLYVLRWWCSYTDVIVTLTTKLKLRLKGYNQPEGLHPGETCQFMLASVNKFGSQGYSDIQQYTKKFVRPTRPGNLEMVRSKLQNNKVDVTIQWQPPLYTDNLPIFRYVVLWSDPLPGVVPEYERSGMHNTTVDGDKTSYTITGLEPGIIYFVQVKAVVSWKRRSINGDPVSTYLETYSIPRAAIPSVPDNAEEDLNAVSAIYNISVSKPAFLQSELKVLVKWNVRSGIDVMKYMVYWVPNVCDGEAEHRKTHHRLESEATTHEEEFFLYNLLSNCQYEIHIQAVNMRGEIDEGRREVFQTPSCMETPGSQPELCFISVSPPLSPIDLSIRFKTSSICVCQAVISWTQPEEGEDDEHQQQTHQHHRHHQPLPATHHHQYGHDEDDSASTTVWNVIWGQSRPPMGIPSSTGSDVLGSGSTVYQAATIVYNTSPRQTQVPGTETKACLTHLENSKHYTVQIVGQSGDVKGDPAVFPFTTPDDMSSCHDGVETMEGVPQEATTQNGLDMSSEVVLQGNLGQSNGCSALIPCNIGYVQLVLLTFVILYYQVFLLRQ